MHTNWIAALAGLGIGLGALLAPGMAGAQRPHDGMGGRPEPPASSVPIAVRPAPAPPPTPMAPPTPQPPPAMGTRRAVPAGPAVSHHFRPHSGPGVIYAVPPPIVYYPGPGLSYGPPVAYDPALAYQPGAPDPASGGAPATSMLDVSPPPPSSRVIEYPTGRYELEGDGVAKPFSWVWIPAAPPPPPAPPQSAPDTGAAPSPAAKIYRWVDEQRVVHFTDNLDSVPEKHRAQAKQAAGD